MRNKIFAIFFVILATLVITLPVFAAEDWSQYESGRDNIRLDGYHGQPGYIAFTDGNGNIAGYLWASRDPVTHIVQLLFASPDAFTTAFGSVKVDEGTYNNIINLSTTQLNE